MYNTNKVTTIILAGGQGSRLFPLTQKRSKPAVPIAGNFRLIDIPISNCLNAGFRKIWILTQFSSVSLHRHISETYNIGQFEKGFISILAATQTMESQGWYQGTADAVRKNISFFDKPTDKQALILSGDHLYQMDYEKFLRYHIDNNADITVSVIPVPRSQVTELGVLKTSDDGTIIDFVEKPQTEELIDQLASDTSGLGGDANNQDAKPTFLASMGIYLFKKDILMDLMQNSDHSDFGSQIIPEAMKTLNTKAYLYNGYWEDVGTIKSFFDAHLELTHTVPAFNFYDEEYPIYTHPRFLPAAKVNASNIESSLLSEGSIINRSMILSSVIGIRSIIQGGCTLERVIMMGADYYDGPFNNTSGMPTGIGENSVIKNAIIDKNAKIGKNVQLININQVQKGDFDNVYIRDGIIIVPKGATVPDNFHL